MSKIQKKKLRLRRVDLQVFVLAVGLVMVSCLCLYAFAYTFTYRDMISSLKDRVDSIHGYLERELDSTTFFDVNNKEDMNKENYKNMKTLFKVIKEITGVQYLYTAKQNIDNELVYVIDGLSYDAEDFRYPGDLIEVEIIPDLEKALGGTAIYPTQIKNTPWGDIFISYLPIHDTSDNVIGVIGIEFEAGHQYETYRMLRIGTPLIILFTCIFAGIFALFNFRRVSNPNYQDLSNTDYLTNLKSRNAFEIDMKNMCAMQIMNEMGIILGDLNGLKVVNDKWGHETGDIYIQSFSDALRAACMEDEVLYRIGGDEFAILVKNASNEEMESYIERVRSLLSVYMAERAIDASCSFGYSTSSGNTYSDFEVAYKNADTRMYLDKKEYYEKKSKK